MRGTVVGQPVQSMGWLSYAPALPAAALMSACIVIVMANLLAHPPLPAQVCIGNHERDVLDPSHDIPYHTIDSGGECGVPYGARFPMPTPGHSDQPWYSFNHGPVHITVSRASAALLVAWLCFMWG